MVSLYRENQGIAIFLVNAKLMLNFTKIFKGFCRWAFMSSNGSECPGT